MKKLKLSLQNIEGAEILSREQLKKIFGGNAPEDKECTTDADCGTLDKCCDGQAVSLNGKCKSGKCLWGSNCQGILTAPPCTVA
ncbi:MAG: hypothetical protein QM640_03180 [Niabella sp.]